MDKKKSVKSKSSSKHKENCEEKLIILEEKYLRLKEILKQVLKDLKHEKGKRDYLEEKCSKLAEELKEKDDLLERMHSVSEAVVDEFSALKAKCDMETEAASNAIKRATRYYQENQILKGNSQCDSSLLLKKDSKGVNDFVSNENISEMEILSTINSDLRTEVACLKTNLVKEKEKQDFLKGEFEIAKKLYEDEMREHKCTAEKLKSLEILYDSVVEAVNSQINIEENNFDCLPTAQDLDCKTENNNHLKNENSIKRDITSTLTLMEKQRNNLRNRVKELEQQISSIKLKGSCDTHLYIPPPPPPPLPPQPAPFNPFKSLKMIIGTKKKSQRKDSESTVEDFASEHQKLMSEMVDAIKKGSIKLKPVQKVHPKPEVNENEPFAVTEMKSILQTLKNKKSQASAEDSSDMNASGKLQDCVDKSMNPCSSDSLSCQISESHNSESAEDFQNKHIKNISLGDISVFSPTFSDINGKEIKYSDLLYYDSNSIEEDNKDDSVMII